MIRQDLRLSQPLIALTTRSESQIQEHLRQAGFDMVLDKPFDLMHLRRTLKR
jgi:CheY-like chemotaxis protein